MLLKASQRCWMADREIGVPGGRTAAMRTGTRHARATKGVAAMLDGRSGDRRSRGPDGRKKRRQECLRYQMLQRGSNFSTRAI